MSNDSNNLNSYHLDLPQGTEGQWLPAAWAVGASLAFHVLGFGGLTLGGVSAIDPPEQQENSHILQAGLMPAQLIETSLVSLKADATAPVAFEKTTGFAMQTLPKPVTNKPKSANATSIKPKPAALAATESAAAPPPAAAVSSAADTAMPTLTSGKPQGEAMAQASEPRTTEPNTIVQAETGSALVAPPKPVAMGLSPSASSVAAPPTSSTSATSQAAAHTVNHAVTPTNSALPSYRLPNQLKVQFEATVRGFAGKSVLSWKKTTQDGVSRYEAQQLSTVAIPFKTFEHRFKSSGVINNLGLAPLNVEEKRPNGSSVATTVEPDKNRVIISSKEGFLPYDPQGHDLVSLMVQLAIYAQSNPKWQQSGTAQDFTVYRPSGIKRWRIQSMGLTNIALADKQVQTIHLRRVPLWAEPDYEDTYHFWLDLNRYGFPVKMRQTDSKGNHTDINLVDWQEQ